MPLDLQDMIFMASIMASATLSAYVRGKST